MRLAPLNGVSVDRKTVNDYKFANGLCVPAGTMLSIPVYNVHRDETYNPRAETFEGTRFMGQKMTSATPQHLAWGLGRSACPGRFFAASELKMLLAHILVTYDFRCERETMPELRWFSQRILPDTTTTFIFQKRRIR